MEARVQEIPLTAEGEVKLILAGASDVGCVRENNEDSYGVYPSGDPSEGSLLVVADGMGGAAAGEVASKLAVDTVREEFIRSVGDADVPGALESAIGAANRAIHGRSLTDKALKGMGTTCTTAFIRERHVWIGHVGDSRAYFVQDDTILQLTEDHSLAAEIRRGGEDRVLPEGAEHVLTRCLGVEAELRVDVSQDPLELSHGAVLVLCSDGLSNLVTPSDLQYIVSMHLPDAACRRLVKLARERGGPDNITVQVARFWEA